MFDVFGRVDSWEPSVNVDEAIAVHVAWKEKLTRYLNDPDGSLDALEIAADDRCPLGRWLRREGSLLGDSVPYHDVMLRHARFHMAAGALVHRANHGESLSNEISLGSRSEFSMASVELVRALVAFREMVDRNSDTTEEEG